jgi:hypothetical protein
MALRTAPQARIEGLLVAHPAYVFSITRKGQSLVTVDGCRLGDGSSSTIVDEAEW